MPDVTGKRVVIVGDSLSSAATAPGGVMAQALREHGATVTVNAKVGRSARSLYSSEGGSFGGIPTAGEIAIVVMGTNDIVVGAAPDKASMQRLRAELGAGGAEVWAFGPPAFAAGHRLESGEPAIVNMMRGVFGARFIDLRPLSSDLVGSGQRTSDGIHFPASSGKVLGERMAKRFLEEGTGGLSPGWALLAASVIGYLLLR